MSEPALRVVRGELTPEELAALVLALRTRSVAARAASTRSRWTDRAVLLRRPLHCSPEGWRASRAP